MTEETKRSDFLEPITHAQGLRLWAKGIEVFILHDDDSESLIYTAEELALAISNGEELGIEKTELPALLDDDTEGA